MKRVRENVIVTMGLPEGTRGRWERERERQRENNIEIHCICVKMV
jgi:hypothetical protein